MRKRHWRNGYFRTSTSVGRSLRALSYTPRARECFILPPPSVASLPLLEPTRLPPRAPDRSNSFVPQRLAPAFVRASSCVCSIAYYPASVTAPFAHSPAFSCRPVGSPGHLAHQTLPTNRRRNGLPGMASQHAPGLTRVDFSWNTSTNSPDPRKLAKGNP